MPPWERSASRPGRLPGSLGDDEEGVRQLGRPQPRPTVVDGPHLEPCAGKEAGDVAEAGQRRGRLLDGHRAVVEDGDLAQDVGGAPLVPGRVAEEEVGTVREEGPLDVVPRRQPARRLIRAGPHLRDEHPSGPKCLSQPPQDPGLLRAGEALEDEVDEEYGVEPRCPVDVAQVAPEEASWDPLGSGQPPGVAKDGGPGVDTDDVVAETGQPQRVEPRAAPGIEDPRRWRREEAGEADDVAVDEKETSAGAVVCLVEMLAKQPSAEDRIAPVELHPGIEGNRHRGEFGRTDRRAGAGCGRTAALPKTAAAAGRRRGGALGGFALVGAPMPGAGAIVLRGHGPRPGSAGHNRPDMASFTTSIVQNHGIVAVLLLMAIESCGIPFPSEVIMPVAGALAAGALGGSSMSLGGAIVAGALGNLVGSLAAYAIAARIGEPFLLGPGRWVGISRHHVDLATRWFARYGLVAVLVGRVLPVVRTYISFPAGLARVPIGRFAVLTFVGALPWCAALAAAGYVVGADYQRVSGPIEKAAVVLAALVLLGLAVWLVQGRLEARRTRG